MKKRLTGYTFDASAQTIVQTNFSDVMLEGIQLITNVTDNVVIYQFNNPALGGTLSTDTLTLDYDTTTMDDTDELMILVEDGAASVAVNDGGNTLTVDGTVTANLSATDNTVLDNIDTSTAAAATSLAALDNSVDGNYLNTNMNIAGTDVDGNSGNKSAATMRVVIATDQPALTNKLLVTPDLPSGASSLAEQQTQTTHLATIAGDTTDIEAAVELIDDTVFVDDAAFTPATSKVLGVGYIVDDTATDSVDEGDIGAPRMSADRIPYVQGAVASAATDAGNPVKVGAKYNSTKPSFTDGQRGDLQLDSRGALDVALFGGNSGAPISVGTDNADAVAVSATSDKLSVRSRNTVYNGSTWDRMKGDATDGLLVNLGANNDVTVTSGAITETNSGAIKTSVELIDDTIFTDDTSTHSTGTTKVQGIGAVATPTDASVNANDIGMPAMTTDRKLHVAVMDALPAGTAAIGKLAANNGVDIGDVDVTSIAAGTNAIGNVGLIGRTSGGLSIFRSLDIDETEEEIKATAGQLFSISAFNRTAAPLYLKFYNATAANVTVGSTTPVMTFVVPGNADSDGAGFIHSTDIGYAFGTAISVACTTGVADADTGAPGANDCVINIGYM